MGDRVLGGQAGGFSTSDMDGFGKIDNCKCLRRGGDGGPGDGSGEFEDNDNLGQFKLHVVAGDNT